MEEERSYRNNTCHIVNGNSRDSTYLFVLEFEEIRVEWPHLLVGFSPLLGFPSYILCLFLDGE